MALLILAWPAAAAAFQPLNDPERLPGFGIHVGQRVLDRIAASTVELSATRPQYSEAMPNNTVTSGWCTAVKIRSGTKSYLSTAAQCFSALTGHDAGLFDTIRFPGAAALDFANRLGGNGGTTYAVHDPSSVASRRQTLGQINGVAVSTQDTDLAVLKVAPTAVTPTSRSYRQIPAMGLNTLGLAPKPGQQVALLGIPQATGYRPVTNRSGRVGTYLGRISVPAVEDGYVHMDDGTIITRELDVVGINFVHKREDSLDYGSSGSSFAFQTPGGRIITSGPLSVRSNITFDANLVYPGQDPDTSVGLNQVSLRKARVSIERALGIHLAEFPTVGLFTVATAAKYAQVIRAIGHNYSPNVPPPGPSGPLEPSPPDLVPPYPPVPDLSG